MVYKGFFQLAKSVSKNSNHRVKIGCVIALHGKPVRVGWNVIKTHPRYTARSLRESIHAEIKAVIAAQCYKHLDWIQIYVTVGERKRYDEKTCMVSFVFLICVFAIGDLRC